MNGPPWLSRNDVEGILSIVNDARLDRTEDRRLLTEWIPADLLGSMREYAAPKDQFEADLKVLVTHNMPAPLLAWLEALNRKIAPRSGAKDLKGHIEQLEAIMQGWAPPEPRVRLDPRDPLPFIRAARTEWLRQQVSDFLPTLDLKAVSLLVPSYAGEGQIRTLLREIIGHDNPHWPIVEIDASPSGNEDQGAYARRVTTSLARAQGRYVVAYGWSSDVRHLDQQRLLGMDLRRALESVPPTIKGLIAIGGHNLYHLTCGPAIVSILNIAVPIWWEHLSRQAFIAAFGAFDYGRREIDTLFDYSGGHEILLHDFLGALGTPPQWAGVQNRLHSCPRLFYKRAFKRMTPAMRQVLRDMIGPTAHIRLSEFEWEHPAFAVYLAGIGRRYRPENEVVFQLIVRSEFERTLLERYLGAHP